MPSPPSADVDSSRNSSRGSPRSALAISTIWRSGSVRSSTSQSGEIRLTSARSSSACARSRRSEPRTSAPGSTPSRRFCATVSPGTSESSWNAVAIPSSAARAGVAIRASSPNTSRLPASGRTTPLTIFTSVDLPAPFSPISACASPSRISKLTPSSATVAP